MRKTVVVLLLVLILAAALPQPGLANPDSVKIGTFEIPGTVFVSVVVEPYLGRGAVATLMFTPYAPGNVKIDSIFAIDAATYMSVTPSAVYVNGTPVSIPATVYIAARTNITAVFGTDVVDVNFQLSEPTFVTVTNAVLSWGYPVKNGMLSFKIPVSVGLTTPSEICSIDIALNLVLQNTVRAATLTSLSGGSLLYIAVAGQTVQLEVWGSPSFTAGLSLDLEPASVGYRIEVGGHTPPAGTTVFLSPDISVAADDATLVTYFNGTAGKPSNYGTYRLEAAGVQEVRTVHDGLEGYTYRFVYADAGNVKYYRLKLKPQKNNECWVALTSGFGNYTFALSVNGTQIKPYGQDGLGAHYVKPFVAPGWIALPGSVTYEVNDSARTVDVAWDNSAYKTVFPQVYKLTVDVKSRKPVDYAVNKVAFTPVLYSENPPSAATPSGKHIELSLRGLYVLFTGDDILKTTNSYRTMKVERNVVHGVDYSGSVDLVARAIALVHDHNGTVQGATVNLYDANTGALLESRYTDANGMAEISIAPLKNYLLEVDSGGEIHTASIYVTDTDSFTEFTVGTVPTQPIITVDVALLIVIIIATIMLLLFAYYVLSSRRAIIVE